MSAPIDHLDPRTPVIVGVGVVTQHADPGAGLDPVELMVEATRRAGADAGAPRILTALQRVGVPDGTWRHSDPGRLVARAVGAPDARTSLVRVGIPQQTLFDDTYRAIADGLDVALVVGGEAARRASLAARAGIDLADAVPTDEVPDDLQEPSGEIITRAEIDGGIASPMAPFAMLDSALRAHEGQTLDQHRDDVAALYAAFSTVAASNPHAAFGESRSAAFLREPSERNRPFAFPYNKWHCAQMNVDQAGAVLVCSLGAAMRWGVERERMVFPLVALESSHSLPVSRRRMLHRWPAMEILGHAAAAHLGRPLCDLGPVELYSCYPVAVRIQQRALGLPTDGVPTITGGEAFAGGPWNNFVVQTTAAMVERVRATPGEPGLVTSLSGLVNKPGITVLCTDPGPRPALVADLGAEAAAATPVADVVTGYTGTATVAAYTVLYDGTEPVRVPAVLDLPDGTRAVASNHDPLVAGAATVEELVGATVSVDGVTFTP
jgi:acetyl-CoA C-acetyltransferase